MTALLLGLLSGWIVLGLAGVTHRYPWRVADLESPPDRRPRPGRAAPPGPRDARPVKVPGRRGRRQRRAVESDLPAAVDLLHVAVSAGHTLHGAVSAVARSGAGPVGDALAEVDRRFRHGSALVDELERLPELLGPAVRPLSTTLVVAASSGTPIGPTLQRLADAERRRVRRRTEERVRRLPVLLLAPLVGLVLPAFVLLTVVPVAITTARQGLAPLAGQPADTSELSPDLASDPSPPPSDTFRSPP